MKKFKKPYRVESSRKNGEKMMNEAMEIVNNFFENEWPKFEEAYKNTDMNFFKDFSDPIKK